MSVAVGYQNCLLLKKMVIKYVVYLFYVYINLYVMNNMYTYIGTGKEYLAQPGSGEIIKWVIEFIT